MKITEELESGMTLGDLYNNNKGVKKEEKQIGFNRGI